jgi:hypothetical protein
MGILVHKHLLNPAFYDTFCTPIVGAMEQRVASARVTCWSRTTYTELIGLLIDGQDS